MCNVLIVDSDKKLIDQLIMITRAQFANVILLPAVKSVAELNKEMKKVKVDIAIVSNELQENCFEIHQQLLTTNPNVKSIILSKTKDFDVAQKALRYGFIDYLTKPITEDFVYALDRAIQSINQVSLLNVEKSGNSNPSLHLQHQILRFIHENYHEQLTLSTLAEHLYLSKHYTSRLVKDILGMTFSEYLLIYRLEVAKKELSTTDLSVQEIATTVGFNDPNYFSKKFKQVTSYTPKQYRNIYHGIVTIGIA
ncbi:two-component system response regulator YesN [Enterococcus sp. PF1-24]|uniref:helix-turn-helix domain-containing protein n=1 Tax=unclassified Enterococcus TaxID=2608891 RepID=UPI002476610D|nr:MULTISPECIES: helix-turn-helix domain-containing protein [unclassified Enterococcus]MDH6364151.1 two-component system response regulator YesN [Enterococcus sp. PFB1-1]MDH6401252.1 two-component system response regulator YesN [Enterococcus sp. PF1-24]